MTRTILHRSSIATASALAAVLALGSVNQASAAGYKEQGAQQQGAQQQSQSRTQSSQNQQQVREVQQKLKQQGHDVGEIDGQFGPKTRSALREFQQAEGLQASGRIDQQTLEKLGIASSSSMSSGSSGTVGGALTDERQKSRSSAPSPQPSR